MKGGGGGREGTVITVAILPDHKRVHVHPNVWGSCGVVPEGESSILVEEGGEAHSVCQDSSDVGGCIQRTNQLPACLGVVLEEGWGGGGGGGGGGIGGRGYTYLRHVLTMSFRSRSERSAFPSASSAIHTTFREWNKGILQNGTETQTNLGVYRHSRVN